LRREAAQIDLDFFDLTQPLKAAPQPVYFHYDEHWNKNGHEAAASALWDYLRQGAFLPAEFFQENAL
jgi:hypothetical protein